MTLTRLLSDHCHESFLTAAGDDVKPADKHFAEDEFEIQLLPRPAGSGRAAIHSFTYSITLPCIGKYPQDKTQ
jgi:hypothetical protein